MENRIKIKNTTCNFQFLVVKPNEHQVKDVHELAEKLGVDEVLLKTAQVYNYENGNELIPTQEKYSRYKKMTDGRWTNKKTRQPLLENVELLCDYLGWVSCPLLF